MNFSRKGEDMDLSQIMDIVINNGIAVAVVLYYLWKDAKLTKENSEILNEVKALLLVLTKKESGDHE